MLSHISSLTTSGIQNLRPKQPYTVSLLPKIGIHMDCVVKGSNIILTYQGITVAKLQTKSTKNTVEVVSEASSDFSYPVNIIDSFDVFDFYPIIDALGFDWVHTSTGMLMCDQFPSELFGGIQKFGYRVFGLAVAHTSTDVGVIASVFIRVGEHLGMVVTNKVQSCELHLHLVDISKHPPVEIAKILSDSLGVFEKLQSIAKTHKSKQYSPNHADYLKDWE